MQTNDCQEFTRILNMYRGLIYSVINKYSFIREHERDDYYQEVAIEIWRTMGRWESDGSGSYSSWLYTVVSYTVLRYRRKYRYRDTMADLTDDFSPWENLPEINDENERVTSLYNAINDMPNECKFISRMIVQGYDFNYIAENSEVSKRYISAISKKLRSLIRGKAAIYFDNPKVNWDAVNSIKQALGKNSADHGRLTSKPVLMLTTEGELVKRYDSVRSVGADGFNCKAVSAVLNRHGVTSGGYRWVFEGETRPEVLNAKIKSRSEVQKKKPIAQYDLEGNYIKTWASCSATVEAGFDKSKVALVAKGKYTQHKGFVWKYAESPVL